MTELEMTKLASEIASNIAAANRDRIWYPIVVAAGILTAGGSLTLLILRLMGAI